MLKRRLLGLCNAYLPIHYGDVKLKCSIVISGSSRSHSLRCFPLRFSAQIEYRKVSFFVKSGDLLYMHSVTSDRSYFIDLFLAPVAYSDAIFDPVNLPGSFFLV